MGQGWIPILDFPDFQSIGWQCIKDMTLARLSPHGLIIKSKTIASVLLHSEFKIYHADGFSLSFSKVVEQRIPPSNTHSCGNIFSAVGAEWKESSSKAEAEHRVERRQQQQQRWNKKSVLHLTTPSPLALMKLLIRLMLMSKLSKISP